MEEPAPRGDLLIIILDCNPFWWGKSVTSAIDSSNLFPNNCANEISAILSHCLNSVLALANAHLIFDACNEVAILVSYNDKTKFLRYWMTWPVDSICSTVCPFIVRLLQ